MAASPTTKALILDALRHRQQELFELCSRLIQIPSENPPGDTTAIAGFIKRRLEEHGIPVAVHDPKPDKPNLVAAIGQGRPKLVLAGHLDEFPAGEGWSFPPFSGALADGKILGRGAGDMKAGLAIALFLATLFKDRAPDLPGRLTLAFASDEETGGTWGTQWLLENVKEVRGDACLIGESSGTWSIGVGEKGVLWLRISATGRPGHAAYGQGESAVARVLEVLGVIDGFRGRTARASPTVANVLRGQRSVVERWWGPGTARMAERLTTNVGTLRGGGQVNLIPARCEAEVDVRLPPGMTTARLEREIRARVRRLGLEGVTLDVVNRCDPYVTPPRERLVRALVDNGRAILGAAPRPVIRLGYTDGRFFRRDGIPTAVYGPRVHAMGGPDESVEQEEVLAVALVHAAAILDYLTGGRP